MIMASVDGKAIGRRVHQARRAANLSQQALATEAGLSVSVVFKLEQGKSADLRVSTLAAVAKALGRTLDWLVWGEVL